MEQQVWSVQLARQSTLRHRVAARRPGDGYSVRSCLAVRRNSSHRIPDKSGEDSEDILEVSRLTGAERQKGQAHGGKAGGAEKAQTAQTRKTCMVG
jgi:hypothetical protein